MRKYIIARIDKYVTVNILTYLLTYLLSQPLLINCVTTTHLRTLHIHITYS